MTWLPYAPLRALLFGLDAETAHSLGLKALDLAYRTGTTPRLTCRPSISAVALSDRSNTVRG